MSTLTTNGVGFVVRQQNSGLEGAFGFGFVLGTNLTLDVQTRLDTQALRNTAYTLSYTDPNDGQPRSISLLHDPDLPYQAKLPTGVPITLTVPASATYKALSLTRTIDANTSLVFRARLDFQRAYGTVTLRFFV